MKLDQETLKKHHFWILLGLVPVVVLAAVLAISASVGAAIETRNKTVSDAQKEIDGKQSVKSDPLIKLLDNQRGQLVEKRTDLWKENWERQIGVTIQTDKAGKVVSATQDQNRNLMRWPTSDLLKRFEYTTAYATDKTQLKFGDKIPSPNGDEYNQFKVREIYLAEFSSPIPGKPGMADTVAPTEFLGGWANVLRHVSFPPVGTGGTSGWGDRLPTSEQLWLALEDIWVQRAVLGQVRAVNDEIGKFKNVPLLGANDRPVEDKLHRAFDSRIWHVELKVVRDEKDGRPVLTGRIRNRTDRLQPLGLGSRLTLKVWLKADPNADPKDGPKADPNTSPVLFHIGGEFLKGGEEKEIVRTDDHASLLAGKEVAEIAQVEQVFDSRTVPVRRIDAVALGFKDSRYALWPLEQPTFEAYKKEAEKAATDPAATGGMPPGGIGSAGGPPPGYRPPGGAEGSKVGMAGAAGGSGSAGGPAELVIDGNRKRYIKVTEQVRWMPVAVTVVVDQAYIQDVLIAYANSPLRFQITQVHWQRFRGTLDGSSGGGPGGGPGGSGYQTSGGGVAGIGFETGAGGPPPLGRPALGIGVPPGVGRPPGGPPPGGPGPGGVPPMGVGGGSPFGPGGTLTSVSESQLTSGMVELTVYGIAFLYEKYQAPDAGATP